MAIYTTALQYTLQSAGKSPINKAGDCLLLTHTIGLVLKGNKALMCIFALKKVVAMVSLQDKEPTPLVCVAVSRSVSVMKRVSQVQTKLTDFRITVMAQALFLLLHC